MTPRILGIVTEERGRFLCRKCQTEVEMTAIIDARNVRAKIWRESSPHHCLTSDALEPRVTGESSAKN